MSDKDKKTPPKTTFSRRSFFRVAGGAAAATAASGGAPAAIVAASQKAGLASGAAIITKIAQYGGFPIGSVSDILRASKGSHSDNDATVDAFEAMRQRLMGGGSFSRNKPIQNIRDEGDVTWNAKYAGKINVDDEKNALKALKRLPKDIPLHDLLSEETLGALYGGEQYEENLDVKAARELRQLIGPLCDDTTTVSVVK